MASIHLGHHSWKRAWNCTSQLRWSVLNLRVESRAGANRHGVSYQLICISARTKPLMRIPQFRVWSGWPGSSAGPAFIFFPPFIFMYISFNNPRLSSPLSSHNETKLVPKISFKKNSSFPDKRSLLTFFFLQEHQSCSKSQNRIWWCKNMGKSKSDTWRIAKREWWWCGGGYAHRSFCVLFLIHWNEHPCFINHILPKHHCWNMSGANSVLFCQKENTKPPNIINECLWIVACYHVGTDREKDKGFHSRCVCLRKRFCGVLFLHCRGWRIKVRLGHDARLAIRASLLTSFKSSMLKPFQTGWHQMDLSWR